MRKFSFLVTIFEGNDEFWEELDKENSTGIDEIKDAIEDALDTVGFSVDNENVTLELKEFHWTK
jgi:hypothetical protein